MGLINVNRISKQYEELYRSFLTDSTNEECFYAINNAMIFAYFLRFIDIDYTKENEKECYHKIVEKYGINVFFHNVKKTEKYVENSTHAVEVFSQLFSGETEDNYSLERVLGNVLEKHINKKDIRKDTGSYYTPDDTTRYMSWNAISISLLRKIPAKIYKKIFSHFDVENEIELFNKCILNENFFLEIRKTLDDIEKKKLIKTLYELKIIDPTCGSGAFIIAAFECLETMILSLGYEVDYIKLLRCLHGVDISKEAVQLTKLRLLMRIASKDYDFNQFDAFFSHNFACADALIGSDFVIQEQGYDWRNFGYPFDCVIGNPPYVESRGYVSNQFLTNKCGNLYAYTIERACNISSINGVISFVVPLPFVSTPRMQTAKNYLEKCSKVVLYGTYADRPGCIFTGVHQRLTIFFAFLGEEQCKLYSSNYKYWYNEEREFLFSNISYYPNNYPGILPKIGNSIEEQIYAKLICGDSSILSLWNEKSEFPIYLSTRIGFWAKAFDKNVFSSNEYKIYYAENEKKYYLSLALLNSSTFYYLWVIMSDCWHITNKNIQDLTFNERNIELLNHDRIKNLVIELMEDLEKNKKYVGSKQTMYEYKHKFSKSIIDEIDLEIGKLFELSDDEIKYVQSYTEKYRINKLEV